LQHFLLLRGVLCTKQGEWLEAEHDLRDALSMADREAALDSFAIRPLLSSYAAVLRKNHRAKEARSIEARVAALGRDQNVKDIVDVTDLLARPKGTAK
jgi:hypothetical protein